MVRAVIALCYIGATILDQSVGSLWRLGGGTDVDSLGDDDSRNSNQSTADGNGTGGGSNRSFEWWSFRAFWEGGRYRDGSGDAPPEDVRSSDDGWFSTPGCHGRMHSEAGWAGYFLDGIGLNLFGEWWPSAAYSGMVVLGLALGGLVAYVLQALCAPVRWVLEGTLAILRIVGCCCRRGESAEVPVLAAPNLARSIEWHGPATGWNTETRYLQERIKGRGSRRKLNDIVVRYEGQVARLQQDESRLKRIDAFGLRVQFASIAGCSSRAFRKKLEDTGEVHLCRKDECGLDHGLHIREFAGLDHEAILDVHDYTRGGTCWLLRSSWRGFCWGLATMWFLLTYLCRCCCRKQGVRKQTKADGSTRILHPDSESEIEAEDNTCEGVRVGILVDGVMRPLAPHGCNDLICGEDTVLLDEDTAVSDVRMPGPGQNARVNLCMHHRQVYQTASSKRKCGVLTCFRAAKAARHGVPLCFEHMDEHEAHSSRRSSSPHPNGLFTSLRKRFNRGGSRGRGRGGDSREVPEGQGGRAQGLPEDRGGNLERLRAEAEEKGSENVMRTPRAKTVDLGRIVIPSPPKSPGDDNLANKRLWIKLNVSEGEGRMWTHFMGTVLGISASKVRGAHRWTARIETLGQDIDVDAETLDRAGDEGDAYIARVLKEVPSEAVSMGRDVHCYIIEDEHGERLKAWDGRYVGSGRRISAALLDSLKKDLRSHVRKHAQCYVRGEEWPPFPAEAELGIDRRTQASDNASQQRKPAARRSRSRSHSLGRIMRDLDEGEAAEEDQPEAEGMIETFEVARESGQSLHRDEGEVQELCQTPRKGQGQPEHDSMPRDPTAVTQDPSRREREGRGCTT